MLSTFPMTQLTRTNATNQAFKNLVAQLDQELAIRDGDDHAFYDQYNKIDAINYVVLAHQGEEAISCGAIKAYDHRTAEIKRMYTKESHRGQGIATLVLNELEAWAKELGYKRCILETGIQQPEAIRLYEKNDYQRISNYGQYAGVETSYCFEKRLV